MRLLAWHWERRDTTGYAALLAGPFTFVFPEDSAGTGSRCQLDRDQEVAAARSLFVSGPPTEPPATRIDFSLPPTLVDLPDSRPGKDPEWHREITTLADMTIRNEVRVFRITGEFRFFVVRGDSAGLGGPAGTARGDPWFVETWVEGARLPPAGPVSPLPSSPMTLGRIKSHYLGLGRCGGEAS